MSKLLEQINTAEKINLGSVAHYVTDKIDISDISLDNYISTENMLSDRGGVVQASKLPTSGKVTKFELGDTLTSNIRPYFKKIWQATKDGGCSNDVLVIRSNNKNKLDENFLYYNISNDIFFAYSMMSSQGTKMPRGDKDAIMKYEISFPDLPIQKKIAEILSAYDEKIENNNKIIKNLEVTAQTIFNEWFINFRFPGYEKMKMVESEIGEIPEGWTVGKIVDLTTVMNSGGTPSTINKDYYGGDISWFSTKELQDGFLFDSEKKITKEGLNNSSAKIFPEKTVVMAIYAAPTVGRLGILSKDSCFNQAAVGLVAKENVGYEFVYLLLKFLRIDLNNMANGAAQQNLNVGIVKNYNIRIPADALLRKFKIVVGPTFNLILLTQKENMKLKESRDQLLAKLI